MNTRARTTASWRRSLALAGAAAVGSLLLPAAAVAAPQPVPPPTIAGVPGLPGPVAAAMQVSQNMQVLKTTPDIAPAGTVFTLSGSGLPAGKDVSVVWMTANISYVLDAKPDSVDYVGRKVDKLGVVLATSKTDAAGAFRVSLKAPRDFGGIHDIYAVVDGVQVAKGGFLLERRMTISPTRGPIGTTITVKVSGM